MIQRLSSTVSLLLVAASLSASCGGGGGGGGGGINAQNSTVRADVPFGLEADGLASATVTVTVLDTKGNPVVGSDVLLSVDGVGATLVQPAAPTDAMGRTTGTLSSLVAGLQAVSATVDPGGKAVLLDEEAAVEFIRNPLGARYVRVGGSDANAGDTPLTAWRTIGFALTQLQAGQTLFVGAGTYPESLVLSSSGTVGAPIELRADVDGRFTGDAGAVLVDAGGAAFGFHLDGVSHVVVRGFQVKGARPSTAAGGALWVDGGSSIHLVDNAVFESDRGIDVAGSQGVHLEGNRVSNCDGPEGDGIRLEQTTGTTLQNNLVYNNARYGLFLADAAVATTLENNTFYRNADDQVHEEGTGSSGTIENTIATEGLSTGIYLVNGTGLSETFNLVWGHAGPDVQIAGNPPGPPSGGSVDPLFVDPAGADGLLGGADAADDDFRLLPASPALDVGSQDARELRLAWAGALRGTSSRTDGTQDGQPVDGGVANLGRHERVPDERFSALSSGEARLFFASGDDVRPSGRTRGATAWGAARRAAPLNEDVRWLVHESAPGTGAEEFLAALSAEDTGTTLSVRRFDGRLWSEDDPLRGVTSAIAPADAGQRGFDLALEQSSGDALFVYADGDANPRFRTFSGGQWSADQDVFATPPSGGTLLWVELVARPGTDEIALVTLDDTPTLAALVWDGSAWTDAATPTVLGNQIAELRSSRAFDAAWESQSGDLLVAWGYNTLIKETRFAQRAAGSGTWTIAQHNSTDSLGAVFRLASDPTTNRIVGAAGDGDHGVNITGLIWDGTQWADVVPGLVQSPNGPTDLHDLAVGWVGTTGRAVIVLARATSTGVLQWARWSFNMAGGWNNNGSPADVPIAGLGDLRLCELRPVPGSNALLALLLDDAGSLFAVRYDGTQWSAEGGGPLAVEVPVNGAAEPFALSFRR